MIRWVCLTPLAFAVLLMVHPTGAGALSADATTWLGVHVGAAVTLLAGVVWTLLHGVQTALVLVLSGLTEAAAALHQGKFA